MEKINKKIIGGILIVITLATVGAVFATADDDGITHEFTPQDDFWCRPHMDKHDLFKKNITKNGFFYFDLTEEQQNEIDELRISLQDQGASSTEIRESINEKLDEFGVFDLRLDNEVEKAEQLLQILNREKELRGQGYSWDEIKTILQDEFGIDYPSEIYYPVMIKRHGFGKGSFLGPDGLMSGEESNQ